MFCMSCGKEVQAGASSCVSCGAPVTAASPAPPNIPGGSPAFAPTFASRIPPSPPSRSALPWVIIGVVGCFGVLFVAGIFAAIMLPALAAARAASRTTDCKNSMKQIGICIALYESKYKAYPPELKCIWRPDIVTDPTLFMCAVNSPHEKHPSSPRSAAKWEDFAASNSVEYRFPVRGDASPPTLVLAYEKTPHPDGKRVVLYFQGRVELLDQASFEEAMKVR